MKRLYTFMILCIILSGCDSSIFGGADSHFQDVTEKIENGDLDGALSVMDTSSFYSFGKRDEILYNQAVIYILLGRCDEARQRLMEINYEDENSGMNAYVDLAQAYATICINNAYVVRDDAVYKKTISHLLDAYHSGLDVKDELGQILNRQRIGCLDLYNPQKLYITPMMPGVGKSSEDPVAVCPGDGIYWRISTREHERLGGEIILHQTDRKVLLDDSMKLEYGRFHVDVMFTESGIIPDLSPENRHISITQPMPERLGSNIHEVSLKIPGFETKEGDYWFHIYPGHHGEAFAEIKLKQSIDCAYIDDPYTYSSDLVQNTVFISEEDRIDSYVLCYGRPDRFEWEMGNATDALFEIQMEEGDVDNFAISSLTLHESHDNTIDKTDTSDNTDSPVRHIWKYNPADANDSGQQMYIWLHRNPESDGHIGLEIKSLSDHFSPEYRVRLSLSKPCTDEPVPVGEIDLSRFEQEQGYGMKPVWSCPDVEYAWKLRFPDGTETLDGKAVGNMLSDRVLHLDDLAFESRLVGPDGLEYHVESGEVTRALFGGSDHGLGSVLKRTLSNRMKLVLRTVKPVAGFAWIDIVPGDDDKQKDDESSQRQNEDSKKSSSETQKRSTGNDVENDSPDKPSETPSAPQGAGKDTSGDESTPDPHAEGNKASEYDPNQLEKDHVDALLDEIEEGNVSIPIPGNRIQNRDDRGW